ncbi:hypothetical protein [Alkalimonas amylolytica]|uniref:Uncharacterized protein n=1 Tax=Alkalimonas amylolytica TaxID=152573 RepID=A0A1H4FQW2_ALKAM|nr:hypothetical protein [Alkalimonas amylolytica]SEA99447.1 hypothetical protein SAMN04488051_11236 [Alkalimonas amylolytica]
MINAANTASSAAFAELKQQMALRVADQAEREAEQLKSQADEKRKEAREMAQTARELQLESGQAQSRADLARASLPPEDLFERLEQQFSAIIQSNTDEPQEEQQPQTEPAAINIFGEATGTSINITV